MNWNLGAIASLIVRGHGRQLGFTVIQAGPFTWGTLVIETSDSQPNDIHESIESVFGSHAHNSLPTTRSLVEAMNQAEKYALHWQKNPHSTPACDCGPIDPP